MRKTLTIKQISLSYIEKNETCPSSIIFIHGQSSSVRTWQHQLISRYLQNYRLIAIDLPGHGESADSNTPIDDYSPIGIAQILSEAIDQIAGKNPFILVGFSYGTNIIAEMLKHVQKPAGIVLIGCCVLGENYQLNKIFVPNDTPSIYYYNESDREVVSNFLKKQLPLAQQDDLDNCIDDYLGVSQDFKPAIFKAAAEGRISDEIDYLRQLNIPVCVVFGAEDKLVNIDYLDHAPFLLWQSRIFKIQCTGHWVHLEMPENVNEILCSYAKDRLTEFRASVHKVPTQKNS